MVLVLGHSPCAQQQHDGKGLTPGRRAIRQEEDMKTDPQQVPEYKGFKLLKSAPMSSHWFVGPSRGAWSTHQANSGQWYLRHRNADGTSYWYRRIN